MELCNLNLLCETDSVDPHVQIRKNTFLLVLDPCASLEPKLIKRPPARWITEAIKNEIKKKHI